MLSLPKSWWSGPSPDPNLTNCSNLKNWSTSDYIALTRRSCLLRVEQGRLIASTRHRVRAFVLVLQGEAAVIGNDGIGIVHPGDCWGAEAMLGAAKDSEPEAVIAQTDCRLLVVGDGEFEVLLCTHPRFIELVARDLARRTRPRHTC